MSSSATLDYVARAVALLQSSQCINSIVNTQGGARHFLGLSTVQPESLLFFPPLGARNATIGLSAFILSLRGDRLGVATIFTLSCIPGAIDGWTCVQRKGNWQIHLAACSVLLVLSALLVKEG